MRDVWTTDALASWKPPLREWFAVLDEYRGTSADLHDLAYWYNERATLSTLAGALWRTGCVVLEEYRTTRSGPVRDGVAGRADLWCRIASDEYTVEAKQSPKLSYPRRPGTLVRAVETQIKEASVQCASDRHGGSNRLAMVFVVPKLRAIPTNETLSQWVAAVTRFPADAKAYYFDLNAVQAVNGYYFPGVALLARLLQPSGTAQENE